MADQTPAFNPKPTNAPEYSVSEIAGAVKRTVEERFGRVRVRGEISAWKIHAPSGHAYFSLKDQDAVLNAVCWKASVGKLTFKPEDGLEVIATGRVTTYPSRSNYQLSVEFMEPSGAGALAALFEKRKAQLASEGLFDPARKRPLPYLPRVIGVVTSPSGAVIRDILHRLEERFPVHVLVWPVAVQGETAAEQVAAAIHGFNAIALGGKVPRPDLLIVARGGGSLEDLWAFNEEIVVRAAAASGIPLISAVGHETDTTLIDFVSDKRAPTPTAAAEMAVPVITDLALTLAEHRLRMRSAAHQLLQRRAERIQGLSRGLPRPRTLLEHALQRFDDWTERLHNALPLFVEKKSQKLSTIRAHLRPQLLLKDITQMETRLAASARMLETLNYKSVLKRGYALVTTREGALVSSAVAAKKAGGLSITFHDGSVNATAE